MRTRKEVRFRSWDKKNKVMIGPWDIGSEASFEWEPDMQMTGMKDKYGKDIYEDDIVIVSSDLNYNGVGITIGDDDSPWEIKGKVCFDSYGWFVISQDTSIPFCDILNYDLEIVIIGNVCEGLKHEI